MEEMERLRDSLPSLRIHRARVAEEYKELAGLRATPPLLAITYTHTHTHTHKRIRVLRPSPIN
jgi:hypothetical protein